MKIVIIEDEKMNVEDLASTLSEISFSNEIVSKLSTVKQAIAYFEATNDYDLIFSDVHLGDGLCFDIFSQAAVTKPIIFCTAFDKYALDAFNNNGIAYILKPYNKSAIENAVSKFVNLTQGSNYNKLLNGLNSFAAKMRAEERQLLVHHKDKILPIAVDSVALFFIDNEITKIHCFNNSVYTIAINLDDIENQFSPKFFRANRQYLINKKAVKEISKFFARKLMVHLTVNFSNEIIISKTKSTQFLSWLSN